MEVTRHLSRDTHLKLIDRLDPTENKRKGQLRLASGLIGNASADINLLDLFYKNTGKTEIL